jgi:hypothetical protein
VAVEQIQVLRGLEFLERPLKTRCKRDILARVTNEDVVHGAASSTRRGQGILCILTPFVGSEIRPARSKKRIEDATRNAQHTANEHNRLAEHDRLKADQFEAEANERIENEEKELQKLSRFYWRRGATDQVHLFTRSAIAIPCGGAKAVCGVVADFSSS